jgi:excinuclease ABC subunit B
MERVEIMRDLRLGVFDVLIGVNLLREGLDFPEVSLVAIMDADKEGFLRSERSLVQTIGRAARNIEGLAIMYADKITKSMQKTMDETTRRRSKQTAYNEANGIVPTQLTKSKESIIKGASLAKNGVQYEMDQLQQKAAEEDEIYLNIDQLEKGIYKTRKLMEEAAKSLDFIEAARLRDRLLSLESKRKEFK